jgi:hypothetical protein
METMYRLREELGGTENHEQADGCGVIFSCRTLANGTHYPLCKKPKVPGLSVEAKMELIVPLPCTTLYLCY